MFRSFKWDQWKFLFKNVAIYSVILALLNVTFSIRSRFQINNDCSTVYGLYFMKEIICVNSSGLNQANVHMNIEQRNRKF